MPYLQSKYEEEILSCVIIIVCFIQDLQRCLKIVIEAAFPEGHKQAFY